MESVLENSQWCHFEMIQITLSWKRFFWIDGSLGKMKMKLLDKNEYEDKNENEIVFIIFLRNSYIYFILNFSYSSFVFLYGFLVLSLLNNNYLVNLIFMEDLRLVSFIILLQNFDSRWSAPSLQTSLIEFQSQKDESKVISLNLVNFIIWWII